MELPKKSPEKIAELFAAISDSPNNELPYLGFLLNEAANSIRRQTAEALLPFGLTPRLLGVLETVAGNLAISQRGLGAARTMDRTTVVSQVDELEKLELLERRVNPNDRREHALFLTPRGEQVLRDADKAARQVEKQFLAQLLPADCEQLLATLWQLYLARNPVAKLYQPHEVKSLCEADEVM